MEMTLIAQGWLREMTYVLIKRIYAQSDIAHRVLIRSSREMSICFEALHLLIFIHLGGYRKLYTI